MNTNNELVAVYGTLRKNNGNHRLLRESRYCGTETLNLSATLYTLGPFPALVFNDDNESPITVEIYEVNKPTLNSLDRLEGYPSFYNRKQIETSVGPAWIYYQTEEYHEDQVIASGDWMEYIDNQPKRYRSFI